MSMRGVLMRRSVRLREHETLGSTCTALPSGAHRRSVGCWPLHMHIVVLIVWCEHRCLFDFKCMAPAIVRFVGRSVAVFAYCACACACVCVLFVCIMHIM